MFSNKQKRETDLSFSVVKKLISRFEHSHQALGFLEGFKINTLGVSFAKGSVFLEGFKVTTLVVCVL